MINKLNNTYLFVEKKDFFSGESKRYLLDLKEFLKIENLECIRLLNCYKVNNIPEKNLFDVFATYQTDNLYINGFPLNENENYFCIRYLKGQYDARAHWAKQCYQILLDSDFEDLSEDCDIQSGLIVVYNKNLHNDALNKIKNYLINSVDSEEFSFNNNIINNSHIKNDKNFKNDNFTNFDNNSPIHTNQIKQETQQMQTIQKNQVNKLTQETQTIHPTLSTPTTQETQTNNTNFNNHTNFTNLTNHNNHINFTNFKNFNNLSKNDLVQFINENQLAMSIEDILLCQKYFSEDEKRNPTWTEIKIIDTYWSDHCRHKTFNTSINNIDLLDSIFPLNINKAYEHYLSVRKRLNIKKNITLMDLATISVKELLDKGKLNDLEISDENNACSIFVDVNLYKNQKTIKEKWLLMFKNETHNHPTEIEPYGGASTCLGGAIRDPLSGRAFVYNAMRISGSGNPNQLVQQTLPGKLPQKKITLEAAKGFSHYGNQIGLATSLVNEIYDDGFVAKRMEVGAVIGAVPYKNVVRQIPLPDDNILLIGGKTGRDGIGGATGSSLSHSNISVEIAQAQVQKGDPVEERKLQRLFRNPNATLIMKKCNDFGAGGVSVAIGELASGLHVFLDNVPKKYLGLNPTELALSESQERMAVVVSPENTNKLISICNEENLAATIVAKVTDTDRIEMFYNNKKVVNISRNFLNSNGYLPSANVKVVHCSKTNNPFLFENFVNSKDNTKDNTNDISRDNINYDIKDNVKNSVNDISRDNINYDIKDNVKNISKDNVKNISKDNVKYNSKYNTNDKISDFDFATLLNKKNKNLNLTLNCGLQSIFDSTIGSLSVLMPYGGEYQLSPIQSIVSKFPVFDTDTDTETETETETDINIDADITTATATTTVTATGTNIDIDTDNDTDNATETETATKNVTDTDTVSIMSYGYEPSISKWSCFHGGFYAVIDSISKIVATGGSYNKIRLSLQEYFQKMTNEDVVWGKPFASLLGAYYAQYNLEIPAIGGKDSMSGTFNNLNVPPTLISFAVTSSNITNIISPEFKKNNNYIFILKTPYDDEYIIDIEEYKKNLNFITSSIHDKKIISCFALGYHGVCEAVIKMSAGNALGFEFENNIDLETIFNPMFGSFVFEINSESDFNYFSENAILLGKTTSKQIIKYQSQELNLIEVLKTNFSNLNKIFDFDFNFDNYSYKPQQDISTYTNKISSVNLNLVKKPKIFIPIFPGTNCEYDMIKTFIKAGGIVETFVFNNLSSSSLKESLNVIAEKIMTCQILSLVGGFSAGDEPDGAAKYISIILKNSQIKDAVNVLLNKNDGLILGICNGFQALLKTGLLPYGEYVDTEKISYVLTNNNSCKHISKFVNIKVSDTTSPWLSLYNKNDNIKEPVSHGEGRFYCDAQNLQYLINNNLISTQYIDNPNGSLYDIESIISLNKRILGKMAHSERVYNDLYKNIPNISESLIFKAGINYFS